MSVASASGPLGARSARRAGRWRLARRIKYGVVVLWVRALVGIILGVPRRAQWALGGLVGTVVWAFWRGGRRRVAGNWAALMGHAPRSSDVRRCFRRIGTLLVDTVRLLDPEEPADRTLGLDERSEAVFREALAQGRGVAFMSAHLGSFERLAAVISARGLPAVVVARESVDPRITSLYERIRRPRGVQAVYRGGDGAGLRVVKVLSRGGAVGFLIDLPARVPCVEMDLAGRPAQVPIGPARLALAKGCEVLVGTPVPMQAGTSTTEVAQICIERVSKQDLQPGAEGERELTRRVVRALEQRILQEPEAWLGMFRALETPPGVVARSGSGPLD